MKITFWLILSALSFDACSLKHPGDGRHLNSETPDCVECHFNGDGLRPPKRHYEGDGPDAKHADCLDCHAAE